MRWDVGLVGHQDVPRCPSSQPSRKVRAVPAVRPVQSPRPSHVLPVLPIRPTRPTRPTRPKPYLSNVLAVLLLPGATGPVGWKPAACEPRCYCPGNPIIQFRLWRHCATPGFRRRTQPPACAGRPDHRQAWEKRSEEAHPQRSRCQSRWRCREVADRRQFRACLGGQPAA